MTKPFELTASDAIKLIRNKKLSIHEWVLSCFERIKEQEDIVKACIYFCLLYTSPSPRDATLSRMPSSA